MLFERKRYLDLLIEGKGNGLVKIVTGIRRCGKSFLLFTLFRNHLLQSGIKEDHIIALAFDDWDNKHYQNPDNLMGYINSRMADDDTTPGNLEDRYYLLLDEVQLLDHFVEVLLSLMHNPLCDIYVTGSNSKFLSSDVVTEFRGRGDEIRVWPLSFAEYYGAIGGDRAFAWKQYYTFGGLPQTALFTSEQKKMEYLGNLFETTYLRDVRERKYIGADSKWYFTDIGVRATVLGFRQQEETHIMGNLVYNELRMRGYHVDVGIIDTFGRSQEGKTCRVRLEVDFVVNKGAERIYIQSAYRMPTEEKAEQEFFF